MIINLLLHKASGGCPAGAIQFSDITVGSSQYKNDSTLLLGSVCFPQCISIQNGSHGYGFPYGAFAGAQKLTQITMPKCTYIGSSAFYCSYGSCLLETISFPKCTDIGSYAFYKCSSLYSVYFPKLTQLSFPIFSSTLLSDFDKFHTTYFPALPNTTTAATKIDHCAFAGTNIIINTSFPNCTSICSLAFSGCSKITLASFPNCTYIGISAFHYCSSLSSVYFPNLTQLSSPIFCRCYLLSDFNKFHTTYFPALPNTTTAATKIDHCAFAGTKITTASFPNCTSICSCAFLNSPYLETISLPNCTYIGNSAFCIEYFSASTYNLKITTLYLPNCTYIGSSAFYGYKSLTTVSLPKCSYLGSECFADTSITTLYIGTGLNYVCTLAETIGWVFWRAPIGDASGRIYVPSSLVTAYKTAKYWSSCSAIIYGV